MLIKPKHMLLQGRTSPVTRWHMMGIGWAMGEDLKFGSTLLICLAITRRLEEMIGLIGLGCMDERVGGHKLSIV